MATNPANSDFGQSRLPAMSVLGILFFMLGTPNIYAFLKRRAEVTHPGGTPRYAWVALMAMAIAGLFELSALNL